MRKSRVIEKFRSGQCATFAALGHYLPFYIRHAAHCEFDGIWLDLEHRAMEVREVQSQAQADGVTGHRSSISHPCDLIFTSLKSGMGRTEKRRR